MAHAASDLETSVQASIQHIALLRDREERLADARVDAERQMLHRIGAAHRAGEISDTHLAEIRRTYASLGSAGRSTRWNEAVSIPWAKVDRAVRAAPNGPAGTWIGDHPLGRDAPAPSSGTAVVYVLYAADNSPCYVGSTGSLRDRLKQHARDGKDFTRWQAYPCADRESAYVLEEQLLRDHLPRLNRRAAR